ncbi:proprotein convertase subtilisin/kexin type 5-like [Saccostrea cucullata]|uniref:proprotein convertase subtilisin/kexin type 5-like n=1 Tax=Saccostrea cuccullata TaxID=36930 RepID=UPI002ED51DB4
MIKYCSLSLSFFFCCILIPKETQPKCLPTEVSITFKTWYQRTKTICKRSCPSSQYVFKGRCIEDCPSFSPKTDNGFIKYCNNSAINDLECPAFMCNKNYQYCFDGNCLSSCPEYTVGFNHSCLMECPKEAPFLTSFSCRGVCYSGVKSCFRSCPKSHPFVFHSPKITHCLNECPDFTAINQNSCNLSCPVYLPVLFNRSCLQSCPATHPFIDIKISTFNKIFICTDICPEEMASYRNVCVSVCPNGTYLDNGGDKTCIEKCEDARPFIYTTAAQQNTIYYQQCLSKCPSGKYGYALPEKKMCVSECPKEYSIFNSTCLSRCPYSSPLRNSLNTDGRNRYVCVKHCPRNTFKYDNMCFHLCPSNLVHYLSNCSSKCLGSKPFLLRQNRTCVSECPLKYLYNGRICDDKCPGYISYIENRTCVVQCTKRSNLYKESTIGKECISSDICPNNTMLLKGTKECKIYCPKETHVVIDNICTNMSECLKSFFFQASKSGNLCTEKCPQNLLSNGRHCVSRCPGNKVINERNCTDECTDTNPNKFKNESIGTMCLSVCPDGFVNYKNECIDKDECIIIKNFYIFNKTCFNECPKRTIQIKDDYHTCQAVDIAQAYQNVVTFFVYAGLFSILFYIICCYKGGLYHVKVKACCEHSAEDTYKLIEDTDTKTTINDDEGNEAEVIVV